MTEKLRFPPELLARDTDDMSFNWRLTGVDRSTVPGHVSVVWKLCWYLPTYSTKIDVKGEVNSLSCAPVLVLPGDATELVSGFFI